MRESLTRFEPSPWVRMGLVATFLAAMTARPADLTADKRTVLAVVLVAGAARLAFVAWHRRLPSGSRVVGIVIAALASALSLSVLSSDQVRLSLESSSPYLWVIAGVAIVGFGGLSRAEMVRSVVIAASILAVALLWRFGGVVRLWSQALGAVDPESSLVQRFPVTLPRVGIGSHPNVNALVLEVGFVLSLGLAISARGVRRLVTLAAAATIGLGLVATGSRSGVLAAAAGLVLMYLIRFLALSDRVAARRWAILTLGISTLVGAAFAIAFSLGIRPDFLFRTTLAARLPVWRSALEMFSDSPLVGHGPNAFGRLVDSYLTVYPGAAAKLVWLHAHNAYLQLLVDFGIGGAGLIAAGIGVLAVRIVRAGRDQLEQSAGLIGSALALALHGVTEVVPNGIADGALVGLVIGALCSFPRRAEASRISAAWALWGIAAMLAMPTSTLFTHSASRHYEQGIEAARRGDWGAASTYFDRARLGDPLPVYGRMWRLAVIETGAPDEPRQVDPAKVLYPLNGPEALNELALLVVDDPRNAVNVLSELLPELGSDEVALVRAGLIFEEAGRLDLAEESWREALEIEASLAAGALWDRNEIRRVTVAHILNQILDDDFCGVAPEVVRAPAVSRSRVAEIASSCEGGHAHRAALFRLERYDELRSILDLALAVVPDDAVARVLSGEIHLALGNTVAGRRDLMIAALLKDTSAGPLLVSSYEPDEPPSVVVDVVRSLSGGLVPVIARPGDESVYVLAAVRMAFVDRRPSIRNPLSWNDLTELIPAEQRELAMRLEEFG